MATKARRRQVVATRRTDISNGSPLREDFVRAGAGLAVNREAGIIPGVKILGWDSANGRRYEPAGVNPAIYEGAKVFDGHKPGDRTGDEGLGVIRNPRKERDGIYGDFHYFRTTNDSLLEKVVDDAERNLGVYGFSHNVPPGAYKAHRDIKGTLVVTEIMRVESVDLVTNPATNRNLKESQRGPVVKIQLKKLLENLSVNAGLPRAVRKRLLEDDMEAMPDMEMDAPEDSGDAKAMLKDGFRAAATALLDKALDGDEESLKTLTNYIKTHAKVSGSGETSGGGSSSTGGELEEEDDADSDMDSESDDPKGKKDIEESGSDELRGKNQKGQINAIWAKDPHGDYHPSAKESIIREPRARQLATLAGLAPDRGLLECICGMSESNAIKVLELAKGKTTGSAASAGFGAAPRSAPAGTTPGSKTAKSGTEALTEGVIPLGMDDDSRAKRLAALRGR